MVFMKKILIVEDELEIRELLASYLRNEGFSVSEAEDGVAAIELFDDVIVLAKDADRTGRLAYYGPVDKVYGYFEKEKIEQILLSINQKDEGGEGKADYYVSKYAGMVNEIVGAAV